MSHPVNDEILENLYEEALASLYSRNMDLLFSKEEIEECASQTARYQFEEMSQ